MPVSSTLSIPRFYLGVLTAILQPLYGRTRGYARKLLDTLDDGRPKGQKSIGAPVLIPGLCWAHKKNEGFSRTLAGALGYPC